MNTHLECIPCFMQQTLDVLNMTTDDEKLKERIMRKVLRKTSHFAKNSPPPAMAMEMHRLIRRKTGVEDPYKEIKTRANTFAMEHLAELEQIISGSDDPFETSLRLAIAGNIMDWGAKTHSDISEEGVKQTLQDALTDPIMGEPIETLRGALEAASDLLYLADNAGEIAFDSLFIDHIPVEKIVVAVKSGPAINDALMEDARQVGLTEKVEVIESGADSPGTLWEETNPAFRRRFKNADLIISKGQGNYEALSDRDENIFFLLKIKCLVLARDTGQQIGDMALLRTPVRATRSL